MELNTIEKELKKRLKYPYKWGRKQNDDYDSKTRYIYNIETFEELLKEINKRHKEEINYQEYFDYALNRWFNFWSAHAVESIFVSNEKVKPAINQYDHLVDFSINGIKFDHKTSVFPRAFQKALSEAQKNPKALVEWLYTYQSQEQRKHLKNRLFIVLYSFDGQHWKLKAEINWLKGLISDYLANFDEQKLICLNLTGSDQIQSDIIWAIKNSNW